MILKYWFEKISSSVWFFVCVTKKEYILNVLLTCIFMPWLLDSLDQPRHGSESHTRPYTQIHTQAGIWDWLWFWPMLNCKLCHQENVSVFIYGETVYKLSYTDVLYANILIPFMIWEQIYRFFCISEFFVDPTHNMNYKGKKNSEKIQNSIWR